MPRLTCVPKLTSFEMGDSTEAEISAALLQGLSQADLDLILAGSWLLETAVQQPEVEMSLEEVLLFGDILWREAEEATTALDAQMKFVTPVRRPGVFLSEASMMRRVLEQMRNTSPICMPGFWGSWDSVEAWRESLIEPGDFDFSGNAGQTRGPPLSLALVDEVLAELTEKEEMPKRKPWWRRLLGCWGAAVAARE